MNNRTMRGFGLLMLGMTAACAAEMGPASPPEPVKSAPEAGNAPALQRNGAPFSSRVRDQLAARGIDVYDGSQPDRTTVELPWNVPGSPLTVVAANDPTTAPEAYAVHLAIRRPNLIIKGVDLPSPDPSLPMSTGTCSGTLVGSTAVLTAAHCVLQWVEIGLDAETGAKVIEKVRSYAITARPRRNGSATHVQLEPHGWHAVKKSFWDFSHWPGSDKTDYAAKYDYAVVRFKTTPGIAAASTGVLDSPSGKSVRMAHYPFAAHSQRGYRMYKSQGPIGGLRAPNIEKVYQHAVSSEPGTSGAGLFQVGFNSVVGMHVAAVALPGEQQVPGQIRFGTPNTAFMLTSDTRDKVTDWCNESL